MSSPEGADFRETTVRVAGTERTIHTERTGTVKQLEAAHTKAVKAALVEMRKAAAAGVCERRSPGLRRDSYATWFAQEMARWEKGTFAPTPGTYDVAAMRKPWRMPSSAPVPEYLIRIAPDEYVTPEVAQETHAEEMAEEILPGVEIRRHGRFWVLRHLRSCTPERPETHIGACYSSAADARWSALNELAAFDWTQTSEEIMADAYASAFIKWVCRREWSARKPSDQWRREDLRKALEALRALRGPESMSA